MRANVCRRKEKEMSKFHIPCSLSSMMLVFLRTRAIKIWILASHEAAMHIMWSRSHLVPRVIHYPSDTSQSDRSVLPTFFLPIVKHSVVERTQPFRSIGRHE